LKEGRLSGVAIQTLLAGALDRGKEAQENFNVGQERLNEMALTMGKWFGLFPAIVGDFQKGDFAHSITFDEIIPTNTAQDKAATLAQLANADMSPAKLLLA